MRDVSIILNGNLSSKEPLNCACVSKYLNKNDSNWELSDFYGQACTRSLQLFYGNSGRRTYAGVYGNGSVRIISGDSKRAVDMYDSIQKAVHALENEHDDNESEYDSE